MKNGISTYRSETIVSETSQRMTPVRSMFAAIIGHKAYLFNIKIMTLMRTKQCKSSLRVLVALSELLDFEGRFYLLEKIDFDKLGGVRVYSKIDPLMSGVVSRARNLGDVVRQYSAA